MTKLLKHAPLALLAALAGMAGAQALPADTGTAAPGIGFSLPRIGGSLNYGVNASELVSTGFYGSGTSYSTDISGDVAYVSKSQYRPFSAVYDGGVLIQNSNQPTSFFQSLSFSQVLSTKRWNVVLSDSVSYLPESPVGGLSGVPGTGDLGVDPISVGTTTGLGILTNYGPRVSNGFSGTVGRQITGKVSLQGTGTYAIQRFIGDNSTLGLDTTTYGGSGGLSYHFSARDTLTGNYNYTNFSYSGSAYSFSAQGATIEYNRQWTRRLVTDFYGGPQIVGGSNAALNGTAVTFAAGASASYQSRTTSYTLSYSRGVNNGSGVIPGSVSDNITAAAHRQLGRNWSTSASLGFSRNVSLPNFQLYQFDGKSVSLGVQGSRRLGRYFSGFASYTLEDQGIDNASNPAFARNAFSGVYQIFSLGITYSPRNILFGK